MATRKSKRRGRRTSAPRTAGLELPAFHIPTTDAADAQGAVDALAAAEYDPDAPNDTIDSVTADAGPVPTPETALSDHADSKRDRSRAEPSPAPAAPSTRPAPTPVPAPNVKGRASLSGKQYRGLKVDQLRTVVATRDEQIADLKAQLDEAAPLAAAAADETLSAACGETLAVAGDVCAMFFGEEARLTSEQKRRLGDVWAPAIRPYLGGAATHMPLLAAVTTTAGIVFEKYWTIRERREAHATPARPEIALVDAKGAR